MTFLVCIVLILCIPYSAAHMCWECTSLDNNWCSEHFVEKDMTPYQQNSVNCSGNCMKVIGHLKSNKAFYIRTCDVTDGYVDTCVTSSQVLGIPRSTVCVCDGGMCNAAESLNIFWKIIFLMNTFCIQYLFS